MTWRAPEIPPVVTPEQRAVIEGVRDDRRARMVSSTAGSGKTRTLGMCLSVIDPAEITRVFTFSKATVADLRRALPPRTDVSTIHQFMFAQLKRGQGARLKPDARKGEVLAKGVLAAAKRAADEAACSELARLYDHARGQLCPAENAALRDLALKFGVGVPEKGDLSSLICEMGRLGLAGFRERGWLDFTDMLWLPLKLGLGAGQLDNCLVDEAQDLNPLQHRALRHVTRRTGRTVMFGDPDQAIFRFAGADPDGMRRAAEQLGAVVHRLSVTFRCPASHVRLARRHSPHIVAREGAIEGEVLDLPEAAIPALVSSGDLVISRRSAPAVGMALRPAARGTPVTLLGKGLDQDLREHARRALGTGAARVDGVVAVCEAHAEREIARLEARRLPEKAFVRACESLADRLACLSALMTRTAVGAAAAGRGADADDVEALIARLFAPGGVRVGTVHASKGLEARRGVIVSPQDMPLEGGDEGEEAAVQFVSLTRSTNTLVFAHPDGERRAGR